MSSHAKLVSPPLRTDRLASGRRRLVRDFVIKVEGREFTVWKGTTSDFSSIPNFARWLVRWSKVDLAGVVHDALYHDGGPLTRGQADTVWRIVARSGRHRANWVQGWTCWLFLRLAGWAAWNSHKRRRKQRRGMRPALQMVERSSRAGASAD